MNALETSRFSQHEDANLAHLRRWHTEREDLIIPTNKIGINGGLFGFLEPSDGEPTFIEMTNHSVGQLAQYTNIPTNYLKRIREENDGLFSGMVNHGISQAIKKGSNHRLLRVMDDKLHAFLSSSYLTVDSWQIYEAVMNRLPQEYRPYKVNISEKRFYMSFVNYEKTMDVVAGDTIAKGFFISTSDVGAGSIQAGLFTLALVCSNGMKSRNVFKRRHLGQDKGLEVCNEQILSVSTIAKETDLVLSKIRDVTDSVISGPQFEDEVRLMQEAQGVEVTSRNDRDVVLNLCDMFQIKNDLEQSLVYKQFIGDNDGRSRTKWGLANAFTAVANNTELDVDTREQYQVLGNEVINLNTKQWEYVNKERELV